MIVAHHHVANLKPELWVCLYDIHYPQFDQKTFRTILSFIKKKHAHGLLLGGDALDLSCVSHWNKNLTARLLDLVAAILRATELALMLQPLRRSSVNCTSPRLRGQRRRLILNLNLHRLTWIGMTFRPSTRRSALPRQRSWSTLSSTTNSSPSQTGR